MMSAISKNKPLYNSRLIDVYLKLIRRRYSHIDIDDLLRCAEIEPYEVADQGHWFSQRQIDLFYERLVQLTDNSNIAREAGRYAASPEALGLMRQYAFGMAGPTKIFQAIRISAGKLTKSAIFESRIIADNAVDITVTPREGVEEKPFQCENRIGFLESVPLMFNRIPLVSHPECIFKGGKVCRYTITWEKSRVESWKKVMKLAAPLSVASCMALFPFIPFVLATIVTLLVALAIISLLLIISEMSRRELKDSLSNFLDSTEKLTEQININYNSALMSSEIGQAVSRETDLDKILESVMQILAKRLEYDRGAIFLAGDDKSKLVFRAGFGYTNETMNFLHGASFDLNKPESKGIFVLSYREQKPFLVNDLDHIVGNLSPHSLEFAKKMGVQSFICCPIISEGESVGILAVDNVKTKKPLIQSDMSLLVGIASVIGVAITNALFMVKEKLMTEQLRHAQKMEMVGRIAGSIAHDFNNMLAALTGYTEVISLKVGEDHIINPEIKGIRKAVDRAAALVRQLLAYSRRQLLRSTELDLNRVIANLNDMLCHLVGKHIKLVITPGKWLGRVKADPGQIEQVLMNLAANARDAMPAGGVLTIGTSNVFLEGDYCSRHECIEAGHYVAITFSDTGHGMDEETKARIFEPFFTTKEVGKGTGLGLASVYGIIRQHNGHINVSSTPGIGTTFQIYLPMIEDVGEYGKTRCA
jgi:signal transduction histidine kinase